MLSPERIASKQTPAKDVLERFVGMIKVSMLFEVGGQAGLFCKPQKFLAQNIDRGQFGGGGNRGPIDFDALFERLRPIKLRPHQFDCLGEQISRRRRRLDRCDCVHDAAWASFFLTRAASCSSSHRANWFRAFGASHPASINRRHIARTGVLDRLVIPRAVQVSAPVSSARMTCREIWLGLSSAPSGCQKLTDTEAGRAPIAAGFTLSSIP